jgi:hypothetical protein
MLYHEPSITKKIIPMISVEKINILITLCPILKL